jgi:hypothetical protein
VLDDLTDRERELVDAARCGVELVCGDLSVDDLSVDDDPRHAVRAEVIRELLLGRRGELDPRGLRVRGARITGDLDLDHVRAAVGLELVRCVIAGGVTAVSATFTRLVLSGSRTTTVQADGVRVDGDIVLDELRASGIRLLGAQVGGLLSCEDALLVNDSGPALAADGLRVDGSAFLRRLSASGTGEHATIRLGSARVGNQLNLDDASFVNDSGPALRADDLRVDNDLFLRRVRASGTGESATIRLLGAHVGGQFSCEDARVVNDSGPALAADRIRVDGSVFLQRTETAGAGEYATIRLLGARVGGQLSLVDAVLANTTGPALSAHGLRVEGDLLLRRARASGAGDYGTVHLPSAQVGGRFDCGESELEHASGLVLNLRGAAVAESVSFPSTVMCPEPGRRASCPHVHRVDLDDFTFKALGRGDWRQWLHLIRLHTDAYRPQPYQQLAAVERAAGNDGNARHILTTQQRDLRCRAPEALGGPLTRWFHWLWGALAGYGYRARRTALALLLSLAAAGLVGYAAGQVDTRPGHHAAERTTSPTTPCSTVELVGLGLDRGLPLGPTGLRARCDLDVSSSRGQVFTVLVWLIQAAVWGLATLALVGYTGLIRKTA